MANLEAAFAGLLVVTTNSGGIPEVLPPEMVLLANPTVESVKDKMEKAIKIYD